MQTFVFRKLFIFRHWADPPTVPQISQQPESEIAIS